MEWTLEDVEETSRLHPESFFIPSRQEREAQEIGRMVRLHFMLTNALEGQPRAERMWVEITGQDPVTGRYTGILTNAPGVIQSLQPGDTVEFEPRHIAQSILRQGDPAWVEVGEKAAMVTRKCMLPGSGVRWMYREAATREQDSGWRLFTGEEDRAYLSDPKNTAIMNVYDLIDRDPSLLEPFKGAVGTAFERSGPDAEWVEVKNWR
ncbi:DUF2185 domain-containing protein [Paenibacillus tritici]|uniref:immunity protein Imm33 domain-containing protein n=1 Tax=Paenibacillus tritici TaxID=1873425 RepID=UPI001BA859E8|nr:DUF2185 domain-containing protein [Paenibacillus tritici]QUL52730.1 DUF2185 domain-containing protein [Paenibacillus tritici]